MENLEKVSDLKPEYEDMFRMLRIKEKTAADVNDTAMKLVHELLRFDNKK